VLEERQYIKDAIYDWVRAVVTDEGRTDEVIWDHGDGPRPPTPFISLELIGTDTPGQPDYGMVDITPEKPDGERSISRFVRRALTMYGFGEAAMDLLETVKASIDKDRYVDLLAEKGLAVSQTFEVTEHPANRSGITTEIAAMFDFHVTYKREMTDSPGWVDTVHIKPPKNLPGMEEITNQKVQEGADG